ncbi:hypothetical protein ACWCOV_15190 [Kribbella sp. NPDC002412]
MTTWPVKGRAGVDVIRSADFLVQVRVSTWVQTLTLSDPAAYSAEIDF